MCTDNSVIESFPPFPEPSQAKPPSNYQTPSAGNVVTPSNTLDDFFGELGVDMTPSTPMSIFLDRFEDDTKNEYNALVLDLRNKMREFYFLKSEGINLTHNTIKKGILGTFDLTDEDYARISIRFYLLSCYSLTFVESVNTPNSLSVREASIKLLENKGIKRLLMLKTW